MPHVVRLRLLAGCIDPAFLVRSTVLLVFYDTIVAQHSDDTCIIRNHVFIVVIMITIKGFERYRAMLYNRSCGRSTKSSKLECCAVLFCSHKIAPDGPRRKQSEF